METKYTKDMTVSEAAALLAATLEDAPARLLAIGEAGSQARPSGMSWSRRQILGHLIDSASNNHQRFVRAQFEARMTFPPYAQDEWNAAQGYDDRPWVEIVEFWRAYNAHLLHVMKRVPQSAHTNTCAISQSEPETLAALMVDYVGHLRHHLDQILG